MTTMTTLTFKYEHTHAHLYTTTSECYPRLPRQYVTRIDDKVDRGGPVLVRNQAHSVVVQLQYLLYQVEYFTKCKGHCAIPWFPRIPPNEVLKAPIRGRTNSEVCQNILFVPLPSFGVNETAKEIQ
jgi:hypothetical protein